MGSSRLRGKSLMPVSGIPLLTRVVNMVKGIKKVDDIIIATTDLPEDEPIVALDLARLVGELGHRVDSEQCAGGARRSYKSQRDWPKR